jgi:hypothetical protein
MRKMLGYIRKIIIIFLFTLSFLIIIPPMPSEEISPQKISILKLNSCISIVLFSLGTILIKDKGKLCKCHRMSAKFFLLVFLIIFGINITLRIILWRLEYQEIYGYWNYNVLGHSITYTFLMSLIFYCFTLYSIKLDKRNNATA